MKVVSKLHESLSQPCSTNWIWSHNGQTKLMPPSKSKSLAFLHHKGNQPHNNNYALLAPKIAGGHNSTGWVSCICHIKHEGFPFSTFLIRCSRNSACIDDRHWEISHPAWQCFPEIGISPLFVVWLPQNSLCRILFQRRLSKRAISIIISHQIGLVIDCRRHSFKTVQSTSRLRSIFFTCWIRCHWHFWVEAMLYHYDVINRRPFVKWPFPKTLTLLKDIHQSRFDNGSVE